MATKPQTNNLKPFKKGERSSEEAAANGRKGGIASGEARREKKLIKEDILRRMSETDWDEMIDNLIKKAKENTKDFEILRDSIGQKPVQDVNISGETEMVIKVGITND